MEIAGGPGGLGSELWKHDGSPLLVRKRVFPLGSADQGSGVLQGMVPRGLPDDQ